MTTRQPTALRQRMLDDMRLRNMAAGTCRSYVRSVADFSAFHGRSPDELTLEDVRDYQLHLVARGLIREGRPVTKVLILAAVLCGRGGPRLQQARGR